MHYRQLCWCPASPSMELETPSRKVAVFGWDMISYLHNNCWYLLIIDDTLVYMIFLQLCIHLMAENWTDQTQVYPAASSYHTYHIKKKIFLGMSLLAAISTASNLWSISVWFQEMVWRIFMLEYVRYNTHIFISIPKTPIGSLFKRDSRRSPLFSRSHLLLEEDPTAKRCHPWS